MAQLRLMLLRLLMRNRLRHNHRPYIRLELPHNPLERYKRPRRHILVRHNFVRRHIDSRKHLCRIQPLPIERRRFHPRNLPLGHSRNDVDIQLAGIRVHRHWRGNIPVYNALVGYRRRQAMNNRKSPLQRAQELLAACAGLLRMNARRKSVREYILSLRVNLIMFNKTYSKPEQTLNIPRFFRRFSA
jgi:hypothetical protein